MARAGVASANHRPACVRRAMWTGAVAALALPQCLLAQHDALRVVVSGQGQPVVLIPSLFGSVFSYRHVVSLLTTQGLQTIVVEPLGIGHSARPADADYSLTAQADRIAAVLDTLRVKRAVLVGHSVGAAIAYRLAYRRPDLSRGIVSIEGGPAESAATPGFRQAMALAPLLRLVGAEFIRQRVHHDMIAASRDTAWVTDSVVAQYTAGLAADFGATVNAFKAMARAQEPELLRDHLDRIACPVLLLIGAEPHSESPPEQEVALLDALLSSFAVDTVPAVGHFIHEEQPTIVVGAILRISSPTPSDHLTAGVSSC